MHVDMYWLHVHVHVLTPIAAMAIWQMLSSQWPKPCLQLNQTFPPVSYQHTGRRGGAGNRRGLVEAMASRSAATLKIGRNGHCRRALSGPSLAR